MGTDFNIEDILKYASLPEVLGLKNVDNKKDYLLSYVQTYLKEEIQEEAAVQKLSSYHRFLKHAALMNAQILNLSNISREAAVKRSTLDGYFKIVDETLLGSFVEPIHLRAKLKEVSHPKFYFFDCGVVRALQNRLDEPINEQKGYLLETFVLNEVRAYSEYHRKSWEISYWGTPSKNEVDFIVSEGKANIGIEVKSSTKWKKEYNKGLQALLETKKIKRAIALYLGKDKLKIGEIEVYPVESFCKELHLGKCF